MLRRLRSRKMQQLGVDADSLLEMKNFIERRSGASVESLWLKGGVWYACVEHHGCVPVRHLLDSARTRRFSID